MRKAGGVGVLHEGRKDRVVTATHQEWDPAPPTPRAPGRVQAPRCGAAGAVESPLLSATPAHLQGPGDTGSSTEKGHSSSGWHRVGIAVFSCNPLWSGEEQDGF